MYDVNSFIEKYGIKFIIFIRRYKIIFLPIRIIIMNYYYYSCIIKLLIQPPRTN